MTHEHKGTIGGSVYEGCECGAVRRKDAPGKPRDEWHVCAVCAAPGFAKELGL